MVTGTFNGRAMTDMSGQPERPNSADTPNGFLGDALLTELSADIAHNMANVLTIILGSLEQLRRQPLNEQGRHQLARAEWGARQAARLTQRVLPQAQGGSGIIAVVDLNTVLRTFVTVTAQTIGKGVQLTAELSAGRLPVRLDIGLLELALLNLIRNAADTMPSGGTVVLRTKRPRLDGLGNQLATEISVSDDGTGMPPAVAQHATDAVSTTERDDGGAGQGLWMAKRFASIHGGKISIDTSMEQGTTVRLALPYAGDTEQV